MLPLMLFASLFPLEPGNQWTYRVDSRIATNRYTTIKVTEQRAAGGANYFVVAEAGRERLLREDPDGRIFELTSAGERLWLDPSPDPGAGAELTIVSRNAADNVPAGSFTGVVEARRQPSVLQLETIRFAPGVGITSQTTSLIAGSSGGFLQSRKLVYARIGGVRVYSAPDFSFTLGVERSLVRLQPGEVTNCAVPCYFVACGFVSYTDPPGTFKPCLRTRLTIQNPGATIPADGFQLILRDSSGNTVYENRYPLAAIPAGETTLAHPLPLYAKDPLPSGDYILTAILEPYHSASVPITILP